MLHYYLIVDIIIEILLQVQNGGTMLNLHEHIMLTYNISRMGYTGIQNMLCFMITSSHIYSFEYSEIVSVVSTLLALCSVALLMWPRLAWALCRRDGIHSLHGWLVMETYCFNWRLHFSIHFVRHFGWGEHVWVGFLNV